MRTQREIPTVATWDAGSAACAQLIIGLHRQVAPLCNGDALAVIAPDAGAPADLPAWCRMTGHVLLAAEHPNYIIQKKA
jgi:tRNA 2-thiouridine synthesizing protein A